MAANLIPAPITVPHSDPPEPGFQITNATWAKWYLALEQALGGSVTYPLSISNGGTGGASVIAALNGLTLTAATQPGFTTGSYAAGWSSYTADGGSPAGYMQETRGKVILQGGAQGGALGSTIFQLPAGMRPSKVRFFPAVGTSAFAVIAVDTLGNVIFNTGTAPVGLDGIEFWPSPL